MNKSLIVVFTGPSGAGKSTLLKMLMSKFPSQFAFSISHTTRTIRQGEVDGREYHFVPKERMLGEIAAGKFLEHAEFAGNLYGTSKAAVEAVLSTHRTCILDVEMEGVKQLHAHTPALHAKYVLIRPPSIEHLEQRLRERCTETESSLAKRIGRARTDLEFADSASGRLLFDQTIINDDLNVAYHQLETYILPFISKTA